MTTTTLAQFIRPGAVKFFPPARVQASPLLEGGSAVRVQGPPLWKLEFDLANMPVEEKVSLDALILAMGESVGTFLAWNPERPAPLADPNGAGLVGGTPTIGQVSSGTSITIAGLAPGYVLSRGDYVGVVHGTPTRWALHQVTAETVTANGSGLTPLFTIAPLPIRFGSGAAVSLFRPLAEFRLDPGTYDASTQRVTSRATLKATQVI